MQRARDAHRLHRANAAQRRARDLAAAQLRGYFIGDPGAAEQMCRLARARRRALPDVRVGLDDHAGQPIGQRLLRADGALDVIG